MPTDDTLYEPHETDGGYIVYRHKLTDLLHLQCHRLDAILAQISHDCDRIAYATYRVAAKVTALGRALHTSQIPYSTITNIMERHRLRHTDNAPLVRPDQLTALLHDIFYAADKMGLVNGSDSTPPPTISCSAAPPTAFNIDRAVEVMSHLLWNVFDADRNRPLSVLQLKQTFLLLCQPTHQDRLIYEHFLLASDHNGCVSRLRFESLVVVMSQLFRYLDPVAAAEHFAVERIAALLHGCFALCPGPMGLNKFQFYTVWRQRRPLAPFEHYASVYAAIGRMAEARDVLHLGVGCVACGRTPVRGLLFRCMQCRKVTLCFGCFATGAPVSTAAAATMGGVSGHETGHRMEEFSTSAMTGPMGPSRWRSFVHKVCAMFTLCPVGQKTGGGGGSGDDDNADNVTMETHVLEMGGIGCRSENARNDAQHRNIDGKQQGAALATAGDLGISPGNVLDVSAGKHSNVSQGSSVMSRTGDERLAPIIATLREQNAKLAEWMGQRHVGGSGRGGKACEFLQSHHCAVANAVLELQKIQSYGTRRETRILPHSSTPYLAAKHKSAVFALTPSSSGFGDCDRNSGSLGLSIKGADINRSYVEANKSDLSIGDLSHWFHTRRVTETGGHPRRGGDQLAAVEESSMLDTDMSNFKQLLHIVKDIIDDSYSDNAELAKVTTQLEGVLGQIIDVEEKRRIQMIQTTESICV